MKKQLLTLFSSLLLFAAASANDIGIYSNPVINQDFPDPTVMRAQDGAFYAARTGGWTSIFKSYNLSDWFYVREAYSEAEQVPSGNRYGLPGDTWACDLNYINGKYVLYFAVSEWGGTWTCGIGCSWSENPAGPYHDTKKFFNSKEIGVENSIDPCYYEDNGKKYLFWGSFCGIYAIELSDDGLSIKPGASKVKIAGASWSASIEGTMIHKHGGYYYLIGSKGSCCEGLKSTYQLVVARSTNVLGPYTNMNGGSALNNNFTTLLSGNSRVKGPGHCSEIITDDKGQDWILYHGYDVNNADAGRKTYLDPVYWKDGWPYIAADDTPSKGGAKPYIKQPGNTLNEKWNFSEQRNTKTQKGWDASKVRNFCYNDGKLYCVYDHSAIKVINAQTGEDLGNLNETDICTGGTLKFCDVKCFNGHIVACNLANASTGEEFRIYCWDNDQENPYLLYSSTDLNGAARIGDCMEIAPDSDWDTNLWLCFANQNGTTTNIIEYNRNAEGWHKYVYPVTTDGSTQFTTGATARAYPNGGVWWIDGANSYPTFFGRENGILYKKLSFSTGETWGSCHHEFWFRGQKYAANLKFNDRTTGDSNSTFKGGRLRLIIDDSGTYSSASWVCEYPTDGLGSTTKNSNATGDVAINTDGNNYIEAWVCSTNQGMAYFTYGTPPTQSPSPILPAGPSIQASDKSIELTTTAYTPVSKTVKITGNYLEGDINLALSGANADLFSLSSTSIAQSAGSADITVTYSPTAAGSHSATLTATSANATAVTVSLTGTATAQTPVVSFDDNITEMTEVWNFSGNASLGSWLDISGTGDYLRTIAFKDGKIYALHCKTGGTPAIKIIDAYTGAQTGSLSVNGIQNALFKLSGIAVIGGKIVASSISSANTNFYIYIWDNDSSDPRVLVTDSTHDGEVVGAQLSVSGDLNNGRLWINNDGTSKLLYYTVTNGTASQTPTVINLTKSGAAFAGGNGRGSAEVIYNSDGTIWLAPKDAVPSLFDASGAYKSSVNSGVVSGNQYGTAMKIIPFGEKKYLAATAYKSGTNNGGFTLTNVTDGVESASSNLFFYPQAGLGATSNDQRLTSLCYATRNDGHVLDIWVSAAKQGVAYYTYNGESQSAVEAISAGAMRIGYNGREVSVAGADVARISVYSTSGAMVADVRGENTLNVSLLARGMYIVRALDREGNVATSKILR